MASPYATADGLGTPRRRRLVMATALACCGVFVLLTATYETETVRRIDMSLRDLVVASATGSAVGSAAAAVSRVTSMIAIGGWGLVTAVILIVRGRSRRTVALILAAPVVSVLAAGIIKVVVARDRPVAADGFAYPSGHATNVTTLLVVILFLAVPAVHIAGIAARLTALLGTDLLVGWARLASSEHWPTDIISGWFLGAALACPLLLFGIGKATSPARIP